MSRRNNNQRSFPYRFLLIALAATVVIFGGREIMIRRARVARPYIPASFHQLMSDSYAVIVGSAITTPKTVEIGLDEMTLIGVDATQSVKGPLKIGERVPILQYNHWQDPHVSQGEYALLFLEKFEGESEGETVYLIKGMFDGHYKVQGESVVPSLMGNEDMDKELRRLHFSFSELLAELYDHPASNKKTATEENTAIPPPVIGADEPDSLEDLTDAEEPPTDDAMADPSDTEREDDGAIYISDPSPEPNPDPTMPPATTLSP